MILRPYKPDDVIEIVKWVKDEKTLYQWSADHINKFPVKESDLLEWYKKQDEDSPHIIYLIACDDEERKPIGHLFIRFPNDDFRHARFGFVIVDPMRRNRGIGREMLNMAWKYSVDYLHVDDVSLGVFENNQQAVHCYQSAGFVECKEKTSRTINGETWKCIEMKRTK